MYFRATDKEPRLIGGFGRIEATAPGRGLLAAPSPIPESKAYKYAIHKAIPF
jgi:hypothetical protein